MSEQGYGRALATINHRADLGTFHPDALPWPEHLDPSEIRFYARLCNYPPDGSEAARAYLAKELAQLADIERHVSICLGIIGGQAAGSTRLAGLPMMNAMLHFAAEEYQHSYMFYRYVALLLGVPLDLSDRTLEARLALFLGPESPETKLVALLASAYPGETVITIFEHRLHMLDPDRRHFLTQMIAAHGLDEARHIQFDHHVFNHLLPALADREMLDAQRICKALGRHNHALSEAYERETRSILPVEFIQDNFAAQVQRRFTLRLLEETLSGRPFRFADQALTEDERAALDQFAGVGAIHAGGGRPC
ncbi:diiron oxygenase [Mesoterricola silvestris]|uniref:p-aminobenzoate N-oxygenase AurF n=1 Tax=Mesoterricola silvestris TaxID=2927979 RepID=A0AA48GR12_9BACT|nr:diiron oxygenase [Mesoterricola silvestris]BDU74534.1 hypothetical protein METEAL_37080 [Mesoterricola silvestris]